MAFAFVVARYSASFGNGSPFEVLAFYILMEEHTVNLD